MYLIHLFKNNAFICTFLIGSVSVLGDFLVNYFNFPVYKAIIDNTTHSLIGGLTWLVVFFKLKYKFHLFQISEIFLCAFFASIVDVDHFLAARSWRLKDATNLQNRPIFHCSSIPVITTIILLIFSKILQSEAIYHGAWIFFAAVFSHHIRDATRRGLWFYGLGSTPPIPYFLYIILLMLFPQIIAYFMELFYFQFKPFLVEYITTLEV